MPKKALILAAAAVLLIIGAVALIHFGSAPKEPTLVSIPDQETAAPIVGLSREATEAPVTTETPAATAAPSPNPEPTAEPAETPDEKEPSGQADDAGQDAGDTVTYAKGYVRVVYATGSGWLPLPEEGETIFPLRQMRADGTLTVNNICVTSEGVYMESSTCDNQDCVHQGTVTLENREERALGNMIICLPNQVYLELYSIDELLGAAEEAGE